ncbi:DUF4145 domain-containing protein [Pseudomonas sp. M2]|uniref:DUF4145 domain-containing protein n=1 Tax=Pseudomonas sp. M2 TaxID=228756 RepID=UPI0018CAB2B1|nr:DUF4145 domain-containing protein [Pseudomonas sp. M2]MBG6126896.1 hypothetical protein [Pseudomonas sp. M2]HDS1748099.1 DUF4145 domain-containing protein [Pseudomonas putida]
MSSQIQAPGYRLASFTCMHCGVISQMHWADLAIPQFGSFNSTNWVVCACQHCKGESIWRKSGNVGKGTLAYPKTLIAPPVHEDLPPSCLADFEEARLICGVSHRGAAALLRLCLQKLLGEIGGKGEHIDTDIKTLVQGGLDPHIQQALDVIRVTGNNAVHPLDMSPEDLRDYVPVMFDMISLIVEERIARPRKIAERFAGLPEKARQAIEKRDRPKV